MRYKPKLLTAEANTVEEAARDLEKKMEELFRDGGWDLVGSVSVSAQGESFTANSLCVLVATFVRSDRKDPCGST